MLSTARRRSPAQLFAVGAALAALAGTIVFVWRVGPVVAVLSADRGVHSGDLLAVPLAAAAAVCWVAAVRGWRRGRCCAGPAGGALVANRRV